MIRYIVLIIMYSSLSQAGTFWTEGFENGLANWAKDSDSTIQVVTGVARSGQSSLRMSYNNLDVGGGPSIWRTFPERRRHTFLRYWVRSSGGFRYAAKGTKIVYGQKGNEPSCVLVAQDGPNPYFLCQITGYQNGGVRTPAAPRIPDNGSWICYETEVDIDNGVIRLYANDQLVGEGRGDLKYGSNFYEPYFVQLYRERGIGELYIDDMAVGDTRQYCGGSGSTQPTEQPTQPTPTDTPLPVPAGINTTLKAEHSQKCIGVAGSSTADGTEVIQWDCHGGANQSLVFTDKGGGYYQIAAKHSGKCFGIQDSNPSNGVQVRQYTCNGQSNQLFRIDDRGGGKVRLVSKLNNRCFGVGSARMENGAPTNTWDCHGGQNQNFFSSLSGSTTTTTPTPTTTTPTVPSGTPTILKAEHSQKCIGVAGSSTADGTEVIQWDCHGGLNQSLVFTDKGGGYYQIVAKHSGKCFDIEGYNAANGALVKQYGCHGQANQLFRIEDRGGGKVRLISKLSGKCIDVAGVSTNNGAVAIMYDCHGGANQNFFASLSGTSSTTTPTTTTTPTPPTTSGNSLTTVNGITYKLAYIPGTTSKPFFLVRNNFVMTNSQADAIAKSSDGHLLLKEPGGAWWKYNESSWTPANAPTSGIISSP